MLTAMLMRWLAGNLLLLVLLTVHGRANEGDDARTVVISSSPPINMAPVPMGTVFHSGNVEVSSVTKPTLTFASFSASNTSSLSPQLPDTSSNIASGSQNSIVESSSSSSNLTDPVQKASSNSPFEFRSFSIARAPLLHRELEISHQSIQHGSTFDAQAIDGATLSPQATQAFSNIDVATQLQQTDVSPSFIVGSAQLQAIPNSAQEPQIYTSPATTVQVLPEPSNEGQLNEIPLDDDLGNIGDEDYGTPNLTRPDSVDNEAIEELVNRFLNIDTLENGEEEKLNKEAKKLINSSEYWNTADIQPEASITDENRAQQWIDGYSIEAQKILRQIAIDGWNYVTSVSQLTKQLLDESEQILAKFVKVSSKQARQFNVSAIQIGLLKRQFELLAAEGMSALDDADYNEFMDLQKLIGKTYAETTVCDADINTLCAYRIFDVASKIAHENNATSALYYWTTWRSSLASKLIAPYERLMQLINKGAMLNGFTDGGMMWRSPYELSSKYEKPKMNIVDVLFRLYQQIQPFYKQLHAYIRRQLAALYGVDSSTQLTKDGPIPAHLLKSIAADNWVALYPLTKPYNVNDELQEAVRINMQKKNYTAKAMFIQAYKYFKHLGFGKLPMSFWTKSVFTHTWSKDMLCNPPTVYDMRSENDIRVKACAQVDEPDLKLAHQLLIHTYYYQMYYAQPFLFRDATNPSFLSALNSAFAINSGNIDYLKAIKLLAPETSLSQATLINHLYLEALKNFVQLPFDIVADLWRMNISEEKTTNLTWNEDWWKLSEYYQGIKPPSERKTEDFDAIAASMIAQAHSPAMRHFITYIMQFQILKALCTQSEQLSNGCLMQSSSIENVRKVLSLGSSITWPEALSMITGTDKLDAQPLLEYYQPLIDWLREENERVGALIGWDGPGTPFYEWSEIEMKHIEESDTDPLSNVIGGNLFAFPGSDCSDGKECLLDSVCHNGVCECRQGLFTLKIGDTYNCVPDNPANAGFGDGHGGLVIGLHATNESATTPEPSPEYEPESELVSEHSENNRSDQSSSAPESSSTPSIFMQSLTLLHLLLSISFLSAERISC